LDGINPSDPAIGEALKAGVTTSFVTMGSANVIGGIGSIVQMAGASVDDMVLVAAAGMKVAMGENPIRVHGRHRRPSTRPAVAAMLREWLERARRYQWEAVHDHSRYDPRLEALAMVIRGDVPLRIHAHRADDILTALRTVAPYQVRAIVDHGTEADRIVDQLVRYGVAVVVGPSFAARTKAELRHKGFHTPGILAKAGIPVAICSDHPVVPAEYLRIYAGLAVSAGMTEAQALAAITSGAARILGIDQITGSILPGRRADLVLWSDHPLLAIGARALAVWVNGQLVYEAG
jgi:imidazolonepropionase-like amidohydrolase